MPHREAKAEWSQLDFERMSWHDNHVHGLALTEGAHGSGSLVFDIDYILEWIELESGDFGFRIAPATLTFHDVTSLVVHIDYKEPTAAMGPFSLDSIERMQAERERYTAVMWRLNVNWPKGYISFEAPRFDQRLRAEPIVSRQQQLTPEERGDA